MTVEPPRPRAVRELPQAGWLAVGTVCLGAFMGQLDASIVTLTFPALQQQFAAPLAAVSWVSLAYLLTLVGLVAAVGRVADAAGRKLVYLYGFVVFSAASAACALAPGLGALIGFRVLQAVGAAMLQANSVALVVTSVPRQTMRAALGVQAAAQALGLALGPALGGLLVATAGWRWVFWVNVPVGVVAVAAGWFLLPADPRAHPDRHVRHPGAGAARWVGRGAAARAVRPGRAGDAAVGRRWGWSPSPARGSSGSWRASGGRRARWSTWRCCGPGRCRWGWSGR